MSLSNSRFKGGREKNGKRNKELLENAYSNKLNCLGGLNEIIIMVNV